MPFEFEELEIPGVILVTPKTFVDERGLFMETYKATEFKANGIPYDFVQDNQSVSYKDVLRGLHFQKPPMEQGKLVRVLDGLIYDVVVDIRIESTHYLKWIGIELSSDNQKQLFVPPGFAHGFIVRSEKAIVHYKTTNEYSAEHEDGIRWDDRALGINWGSKNPLISEKDEVLKKII